MPGCSRAVVIRIAQGSLVKVTACDWKDADSTVAALRMGARLTGDWKHEVRLGL